MQSTATTVKQYLKEVPKERQATFNLLRQTIVANIPAGFKEQMNYGMIGYVVPHSIYPAGYHCKKSDPLPFANLASQKNFIGFYHMGLYCNPQLLKWFVSSYPDYSSQKLDMGKSCVRFKKIDQIPYDFIGQLMQKMTVEEWISQYEDTIKR